MLRACVFDLFAVGGMRQSRFLFGLRKTVIGSELQIDLLHHGFSRK